MTDITLTDVKSGYNLSTLNGNFDKVESVINEEVVHNTGGNNIMRQALDMNGYPVLNAGGIVSPSQIGYEAPVLYEGGIQFGLGDNTKTIDRDGIVYAPLPSELPFTTSGTWTADDENRFFVIQGLIVGSAEVVHRVQFTTDILTSIVSPPAYESDYYDSNNIRGSGSKWIATGGTGTPGTIDISNLLAYNSNGDEYTIDGDQFDLSQLGVIYGVDTSLAATSNSDIIESVSNRVIPIPLIWTGTVYSKRPMRINIAANWVSPVSWIGKLMPATTWDNTGGNYMVKFEAGSTEFAPTNALFGLKIFGVQLDAQNRADIEYGFYFNWLQFPEFKKIRVTNVSASANSWAVYIGAYQAKDGSANTFGQMGAMDEFDLILSSNSLKIGGVDGQGFGGGIHNAMTLTTPRCGGSANQGDGIYIAGGYANQLIGGTIEGFDVGFRNGTGHNSFHGTNIEQNSTHFVNDEGGYISGFGHQSPSWEQADKNFSSLYTLNGIMNNMFINQDQDNLLIDPRFDTNFHNNKVGGSVVPVSGNPDAVGATGKNVLEFVGGSPSSTERANFKVIPKEVGTGSGWHTLVIRARKKTSAVSASLFVQLTGATITEEYGKTAGTTGFELLEVACKQFVAGKNRTGTLTNDFRVYMCSFKVDDGANINLRILSQFGETVLDYVGLFKGTCGAVPKSLIEFDAETDISGVNPGGQVIIYDMSSKSSSATMKIQSRTIGGAGIPQRNIDYLPVDWQYGINGNPNGIVTSYHYDYVTYGPSSASPGSTDHIFIVNSGSFRWLQRAAAHPPGTILQTKFTLDSI